jgi:iodothyronine deiodinase-like protein
LYKAYKNNPNVAILLIYVNEAHPVRSKKGTAADARDHRDIGRATKIQDRVLAASKCMEGLKLTLPILIDGMDSAAQKAYRGSPAATAVIDLQGKIVLHTIGPSGARPDLARREIEKLLAKGGFPERTSPPASQPASRPATQPAGTGRTE